MAHIPDGVLAWPVLAAGAAAAATGVAIGLRRIGEREIPRVAILAAAFFALSLFSIPVGPSGVHLMLGALMGLLLRSAIFPAVLVALGLQAAIMGFGGLTSLGVNVFNIALPGAIAGFVLTPLIARADGPRAALLAGAAAAFCVAATGLLVAAALYFSSPDYALASRFVLLSYLPLIVIEALVTGFCISFVKRVKPELLEPARLET